MKMGSRKACQFACNTLNRFYSSTPKPFSSIPAPKGLPIIGTLLEVLKAGGVSKIHNYIDNRHRQLGPIFREKLGTVEAVWVADPGMYQEVYKCEGPYPQLMHPEPWVIFNKLHGYKRGLFFMNGEEWSHYRKLLSPLLLKLSAIEQHHSSLERVADQLLDSWQPNGPKRTIDNLEKDLYCYLVQGLMCAMFGDKIGLDRNLIDKYGPSMAQSLHSLFVQTARMTLVSPSLASKFKLEVWKTFERAAVSALETALQLTNVCLDHGGEDDSSIVASLRKQNVAREDIIRIMADLFIAASDTTSHTLQWVLYLLATHPEVQEKVTAEIAKEKDWQKATILKGSVKEALRLYPVATFLTRLLPKESTIGGYNVPAQTLVLLSIYSSGRNDLYYQNANLYLPERWSRSTASNSALNPYASLPFGHGKRSCIGRRLAEVQMYILLSKAIPRFVFRAENQVEYIMRLLGTVDKPVILTVEPRT